MFRKVETNNMKTPVMPDSSLDSQEHAAEAEQAVRGRGSPMEHQGVSRRTLLKGGGAALAALTMLRVAGPTHAFGQPSEEVIPWLDQPPANGGNQLVWEALDSWLTPAHNFFYVNHYGQPDGLDESTWRVDITGLVAHPQSMTLADLKARAPRGGLHLGVLGQSWLPLLHRRRRQCPLGGNAAGLAVGRSGCPGAGHRSDLLGG
jgi:hypothetical protein